MIFDEASSWWSLNIKILLHSNFLKELLDSCHVQLSKNDAEHEANKDIAKEGDAQKPWKIVCMKNNMKQTS